MKVLAEALPDTESDACAISILRQVSGLREQRPGTPRGLAALFRTGGALQS